ncbi:MAG: DNA-binding protein [Gammaproteobacteria bacterium]|nr:DNA-binding protein [Gammaproteobacteria bacterium]
MSRIGITFEEVKKAIGELQGKQKNPTVDAIREILGTGSKSTIARFLREWKTHYGLSTDQSSCLPPDLLGMVNGLWDALQHKAEDQIHQYRQEVDAIIAQTQQELTHARQQETALKQQLHSVEETNHQQKEEIQQLSTKLIAETQEKIKQTERVNLLESYREENLKENQRLHQLLKHVQENLEHYQTAIQQLRQEQSILIEKQQNDYEQRLTQLNTQVNKASSEKAALYAQHEQLSLTHTTLTADYKTLLTQYTEANSQLDASKIQYDKLQQEHTNIKEQQAAQMIQITTQQQTMIELQLTLKITQEKMTSLETLLSKANDKIDTLRHELQFALQEKAHFEGQLAQMQLMLTANKVSPIKAEVV